jgi:hypothetical protein
MFSVGDLVVLKTKGVATSRYHPDKKVGIIKSIRREVFLSYTGDKEDAITVYWMPLNTHETVMEFYLEFAEKE